MSYQFSDSGPPEANSEKFPYIVFFEERRYLDRELMFPGRHGAVRIRQRC